jgi:hypothetical protein
MTDFQYRYSFISLLSCLFRTTIHTTQVNSIRPTVIVKRESKLTQKLQRSFSCRRSWKRSFSHPTHCPTRSLQTYTFPDVHPSNNHCFYCVPECSSLRMYFIHSPIEWTTHNLSTVNIFSAPPKHFSIVQFFLQRNWPWRLFTCGHHGSVPLPQ